MLVKKSRLQLLGCACLLIASKYEEIHPPTVEELAYISDDTYTSAQIRKVWMHVNLKKLRSPRQTAAEFSLILNVDGEGGFKDTIV